MHQHTKN